MISVWKHFKSACQEAPSPDSPRNLSVRVGENPISLIGEAEEDLPPPPSAFLILHPVRVVQLLCRKELPTHRPSSGLERGVNETALLNPSFPGQYPLAQPSPPGVLFISLPSKNSGNPLVSKSRRPQWSRALVSSNTGCEFRPHSGAGPWISRPVGCELGLYSLCHQEPCEDVQK